MLKPTFANVMVAGLLLGAAAANAAESPFPSSVNETTPFSFPAASIRQAPASARASESPYPSSVSETSPFSIPAEARTVAGDRLQATHGSVFPTSANEVGGAL